MKTTRRKHSREFKIEAIRMIAEQGLTISQAARDLGIDRSLLAKWKRELESDPEHAFPGKGRLKPMEEELRRLRACGDAALLPVESREVRGEARHQKRAPGVPFIKPPAMRTVVDCALAVSAS